MYTQDSELTEHPSLLSELHKLLKTHVYLTGQNKIVKLEDLRNKHSDKRILKLVRRDQNEKPEMTHYCFKMEILSVLSDFFPQCT